jgi:salicylate hydroxylase
MSDGNNGISLRVAIIGAGMGGLATALALAKSGCSGHITITVYEAALDLGFVGAGIQVAPNLSRILSRFGILDSLRKEAVQLNGASIRSVCSRGFVLMLRLLTFFRSCSAESATGEELAYVSLLHVEDTYGFPHLVCSSAW